MKHSRASISVDLDNQWAYMKTQGAPGWERFPSYLDQVVPRILEEMDSCEQSITFFIVGKDAEMPENEEALRSIAEAGHEIANHSYMHEPWLHLYSDAELKADFEKSENAIIAATGVLPEGFRGPGFSSSAAVREMLVARGYAYDASLFPTVVGPLARAYFMLNSTGLSKQEKQRRAGLYGRLADALSPLRPYEVAMGLPEVPVTTMPFTRLPIHLSYLLFLTQISEGLARLYWRTALSLCRVAGVAPSLLLHPTDFLDHTDVPEMAFFPAMRIPAARKMGLVRHVVRSIQAIWPTGTVAEHARTAEASSLTAPGFSFTPQTKVLVP